jgi:hypothetical protein
MASPLQIILNDRDYQEARDTGRGGPKKDFFADRDREFRDHKAALVAQLGSIAQSLERQAPTVGDIGYIKVILRREAWAKSHRPFSALFKPTRLGIVGGGDLGEMYFEAQPRVLREIARDIAGAEEQTRHKLDKARGKEVPNPSAARSETGAIAKIELYGPRDRRSFSVEEAVSWLARPMTGSAYQIELFDLPPPHSQLDAYEPNRQKLYSSFIEGLTALGDGLSVQRLPTHDKAQALISARLERSGQPPILLLDTSAPPERAHPAVIVPFDQTLDRHRRLLAFLDHHPLVRHVDLPPVVVRGAESNSASPESEGIGRERPGEISIPTRSSTRTYPRMGIIDGGLSSELTDWVIDKWDLLDAADADLAHGTFIGGLAVAGSALNGGEICAEPDGAEIVDVAVYPNEQDQNAFSSYFPQGVSQFFEEVNYAIADAKARHGVRVFNMSLSVQLPAQPDRYSQFASQIDQIAEDNDVILFLPTGNTAAQDRRPEWPADETQALVNLATPRSDAILMPAESVRNVAVAALNPPDLRNSLPYAPARYSRRGPGLRAGVKPDLAHVGGSGSPQSPLGHGLFSIRPDGSVCDGCGTSYATPLVAKTAAVLEHSIEGTVSRETLIALLLHHAEMPQLLQTAPLNGVARDLVGFGVPPAAADILQGDDHQISLVFASRLRKDQQIAFNFAWPASLVDADGKCHGSAHLTIVSTPPLDPRFGSEFVRINIDAALQQEHFDKKGKPSWKGRLEAIYLPGKAETPVVEAERIEHGLKWSPVKGFARTMPRGVGNSSNWRLFVEYLTRAGEDVPENGVPFTAILTISDPTKERPVFAEMRQSLQSLGVRIEDIRTAARVATRI